MENNKKQTAVEWLFNQIKKDIIGLEYDYADELKQAKEMEKEQIKDAYEIGFDDAWDSANVEMPTYAGPEQYYNETYKIDLE